MKGFRITQGWTWICLACGDRYGPYGTEQDAEIEAHNHRQEWHSA